MDGLIIFDQQNDIIYIKYNDEMKNKLYQLAKQQGLMDKDSIETDKLDTNIIIQLFSPIIASQRIMSCQFDNSYTSIECSDNLIFVFEENLGYLFLKIGVRSEEYLQRSLGVCCKFVKSICGPDYYLLKSIPDKSELLTNLIQTWENLYNNDQSVILEAIEHLLVNIDLKQTAQKAMEYAIDNLKQDPHSQRSHAVMFVKNKFLASFTSKQAQELSPADILFLSIFCQSLKHKENDQEEQLHNDDEDDTTYQKKIQSFLIFLQGYVSNPNAGCIPNILHVCHLDNDIILLILVEYGSLNVSNSLFDIFYALNKTQKYQMQNDLDNLKPAFDQLDVSMKQLIDSMKRAKYNIYDIEMCLKRFVSKWDLLKRKYNELFKSCDKDYVIAIESNIPRFFDSLKELFKLTCVECYILENGVQRVTEIASRVQDKLVEFIEFLGVKAERNCLMGSYLEEFPGMIHFIHIDRSNGKMIAPNLCVGRQNGGTSSSTSIISRSKIWAMIEFTRSYLQKGHLSLIWKDTAFSYSYFIYFEDQNGVPIKPKELPNTSLSTTIKPQVVPGILSGEFYQWLIETCFRKTNKIKCYELYCIHLGLASTSCVLEHNRRLAATIMDVTGITTHSITDIF